MNKINKWKEQKSGKEQKTKNKQQIKKKMKKAQMKEWTKETERTNKSRKEQKTKENKQQTETKNERIKQERKQKDMYEGVKHIFNSIMCWTTPQEMIWSHWCHLWFGFCVWAPLQCLSALRRAAEEEKPAYIINALHLAQRGATPDYSGIPHH